MRNYSFHTAQNKIWLLATITARRPYLILWRRLSFFCLTCGWEMRMCTAQTFNAVSCGHSFTRKDIKVVEKVIFRLLICLAPVRNPEYGNYYIFLVRIVEAIFMRPGNCFLIQVGVPDVMMNAFGCRWSIFPLEIMSGSPGILSTWYPWHIHPIPQ